MAGTLRCLAPLLQPVSQNTHATLIMLFLNATHEARNLGSQAETMTEFKKEQMLVLKYMPLKAPPRSYHDPILMKSMAGADLVRNYDM